MRNAYSPIDRLAAEMARPKGTGAEFMTELSKKPGYKQAEVEDRDLQTLMALPKMAREEFLAALKAKPAVKPREKVLSGSSDTSGLSHAEQMEREMSGQEDEGTHHEEYTLPGGENYREILLKHPQGNFRGVTEHFGEEPDILASIRVKDRTGPNGEKILHLEEIQSDWHQSGREKGYAPKGVDLEQEVKKAAATHQQLSQKLKEAKDQANGAEAALASNRPLYQDPEVRGRYTEALKGYNRNIMDLMPQVMKAEEAHREAKQMANYGIPDAPYKKNWHELALKRMIQHAAENGYDSIAVTPGEEQAKRYGLSKHVGMVSYNPDEKHFQAFKPNRETLINEKGASPERVAELIGKDAASRLMASPRQMGHHSLEGENLDVGGEGMKGFYDKMLPKFLNQFGKKYGAQVGQGAVSIVSTPAQHHGLTEGQFQRQTPEEQERMVRQHAYAHEGAKTTVPVHTFPITPEMREDVTKNGIPLYAKGGSVEDDEPKETVKAYKLFRVDKRHPGKLFPLFIGKNEPVDMGKWVPAEHIPTKGFAERPGWHAGDLPMATHIGEKSDTSLTAPDRRPRNQVWTEIEMPNDVDWQTEANKRGTNPHGRVVPVKAHITDQVPTGGHYRYKTNPNMTGSWLIGGAMKVNRILHDKEVKAINRAAKQADLPRHEPFDPKEFGFAEGGEAESKAKFIKASKVKDVLYRGGVGHPNMSEDFLKGKARPGYATFASTSPHVAGSYAHPDQDEDLVGAIAPMHIKVHTLHEFPVTPNKRGHNQFSKSAFDQQAQRLKPGHALVARQVFDYGPRASTKTDPERLYSYPSDIYAWNEGTETKSALSKAKGGIVSREAIKPIAHGIIKERVTVSPDKDVMQYELMSAKHFTKKVKR